MIFGAFSFFKTSLSLGCNVQKWAQFENLGELVKNTIFVA